MGRHLVLVGAGHAHLTTMLQLPAMIDKGHRATVITPGDYHYYSGMGPGLLAGTYRPEEVRFHITRMAAERGAQVVTGKVVRIDPAARTLTLASGETVTYDVASFNTGSRVDYDPPKTTAGIYPVKPIENLLCARKALSEAFRDGRSQRVVVVGGGAAGVELAANIDYLAVRHGAAVDLHLVAGEHLLGRFTHQVRRMVRKRLARRGITVREGVRLLALDDRSVTLSDGKRMEADAIFLAVGTRPHDLYRQAGLDTDAAGGLLVNQYLQAVAHADIFGGGDCIGFDPQPLDRVGVYAVRQNPVLAHNLAAALDDRPLQPFTPQKHFLLIFNLGHAQGLISWKGLTYCGGLAFRLKDHIDRKFMRAFQVSGELDDL